MPPEKDWVLLAGYIDTTHVRGHVAFELARTHCPGLGWTPNFEFVEVNLNGQFLGLYELGEHVEISANKINVTKAGTSGLGLTGAYTLEIDQRMEADGATGFRTAIDNVPVVLDDPDGANVDHVAYMEAWINNFEAVLYSAEWLHPVNGYARFVDWASIIDWYLINELTSNEDSPFTSSVKMYKTRDTDSSPGRLFFGPIWDFDLSFDNDEIQTHPAEGWWTRTGASWIDRMMDDPTFWSALVARWQALSASMDPNAVIDAATERIAYALKRDRQVWSYDSDSLPAMKNWLATRIAWLDTQFV